MMVVDGLNPFMRSASDPWERLARAPVGRSDEFTRLAPYVAPVVTSLLV